MLGSGDGCAIGQANLVFIVLKVLEFSKDLINSFKIPYICCCPIFAHASSSFTDIAESGKN